MIRSLVLLFFSMAGLFFWAHYSVSVTYVKKEDKEECNHEVWFLTERHSRLIGYQVIDDFLYITFPFLLEEGSEIRISFEES